MNSPTLTKEQQVEVEGARATAQKLARVMARRCPGFEPEELRAIADAKLTTAVLRYDRARGTSLSQFALKAMVGAIFRAARKQESEPLRAARRAGLVHVEGVRRSRDLESELIETDQERLQRSRALGEDFAAAMFIGYAGKQPQASSEEAFFAREAVMKLREAIAALGRKDAMLLELLYWEEQDWDATAARLEESVSSAQRREEKLLQRLKATLEAKGVRGAPPPMSMG